ncbi:hypothetical protein [Mesobacillus zeae]|uniref:Uncharacterized protein n=1 Tax=Mesobacillus zeae TaxID=1917180 RepID=A0A398B6X4_9BACI|nr:hypothetical protein [Mesobacillus zeae]RID85869.1 hypothetical protein D1970_10120 [Mesobacillus zeae]
MFVLTVDEGLWIQLLLPKDAPKLTAALKKNQKHLAKCLSWAVNLPDVSEYEKVSFHPGYRSLPTIMVLKQQSSKMAIFSG